MLEVEFNVVKGHPTDVYQTLNRKIGQYKANYSTLKIGITGRDPQKRFNEHLNYYSWSRMVVIYQTNSIKHANMLEDWLVEKHWEYLTNQRKGGGSYLTKKGPNYLYVLLG